MSRRHLRPAVGVATLLIGVVLLAHQSGNPDLFGRYSLRYAVLLLGYAATAVGGLVFWIAGEDVIQGLERVVRSPTFWAILGLLLVPTLGVALRFARMGDHLDIVRLGVLLGGTTGFALTAVGLAGRAATRAMAVFQAAVLAVLGGFYVATLTISPLLGDWIERNMGLPAESTLDVVRLGEYDPSLVSEPGARFVYTGPPGRVREFAVEVVNNSWGFHDRERTFAAAARPRVVVVGDAYVQALEVPRDSAFPALLEDRLRADFSGAEVVRLARRSAGQVQELQLLREYGPPLRPDLVILVWATNDLLENHPGLAERSMDLTDELLFSGLLLDRMLGSWMQKRLYHLNEKYRLGVLRPDYWAYLDPTPPGVAAAFERTEELLDLIVQECETLDADLLIVIKRPTNELRWLRRFPGLRSYDVDVDAHAEWLAGYARSRGVHFLDLGRPFQDYYDAHPTGHPEQYSWPHAGFLRESGHRLAADLIYRRLKEEPLLDGPNLHGPPADDGATPK